MNTLIATTVMGCIVMAVIGFVGIKVVDAIRNLDDHMEKRKDEIVKSNRAAEEFEHLPRFLIDMGNTDGNSELKEEEVKPKKVQETKPPKKVAEKSKQSVSEPPTVFGEKWEPIVYTTPTGNDIADNYLISNKGRVWIKSAKRLAKLHYAKNKGYVVVTLRRADGRQGIYCVKTIVMKTFFRPFNVYEYKVVCIDGNELDCSINNLKLEKIVRR